jgi:tripartite-type tricarboxylate transporter receptor subunit TctC
MRHPNILLWASALSGILLVGSTATTPALAKDYYAGKTITVLVGFSAGGGTDVTARIMARHLGKNIPGNPTVIVKNMPGGGGIKATNFLKDKGKPDGLTIVWGPWQPFAQIIKQRGMRFKYQEMTFIAGARSDPQVMFMRKDAVPGGATKPSDIMKATKNLRYAAIRPTIALSMFGRPALNLLGVKYRYVPGYKGGAKVRVATRSGEADLGVHGLTGYRSAIEPNQVKKGIVIGLFTAPVKDASGNYVRSKSVPELPHFLEVYKEINNGKMPSGPTWEFMKLFIDFYDLMSHGAFGPPNMNKAAAADLTKGFEATLRSDAFIVEHLKRTGGRLAPRSQERAISVFDKLSLVDPKLVAFTEKFLNPGGAKRKKKKKK